MLILSVLDFCGGIKIRNESLIGLIYFPRPFNDTYSANKNDKLSKNKKIKNKGKKSLKIHATEKNINVL